MMVQQRGMISTAVTSQKIEHKPRVSEEMWSIVILVAYVGEIWSKPVRLQVESTYVLEIYGGALT